MGHPKNLAAIAWVVWEGGPPARRYRTAARAPELGSTAAAGFACERLRMLQRLGFLQFSGCFLRCHGFSFIRIAPMGGGYDAYTQFPRQCKQLRLPPLSRFDSSMMPMKSAQSRELGVELFTID